MKSDDPILLVEDDKIDQKSVKRAFADLKIGNPLIIVQNGQEALTYLKDAKNKRPRLILLDLRMPIMNGLEFLKEIKRDDSLKVIPVVVLTTSREDQDLRESFEFGAAGYMVKPVDYKQFVEVVRQIHLYWILSLTPPDSTNLKEALWINRAEKCRPRPDRPRKARRGGPRWTRVCATFVPVGEAH